MSQSSGDPRPMTAQPLTARSMWRRTRWTILGVIASVLAAGTCLSMAVSGPPALNCVGASDAIAPSAVTDKTIAFSGGDISFTAPFEATAPWTLEWSTNANTAMVWLYDARVDVSSPNTWNRVTRNEESLIQRVVSRGASHGRAVIDRSGTFCLTAGGEWMYSAEPTTREAIESFFASRPRIEWRVVISR